MDQFPNRRKFIKNISVAGAGLGIAGITSGMGLNEKDADTTARMYRPAAAENRVGIIGLDTSHSVAFTKALNDPAAAAVYGGYKVVAAYPKGSNDIKSSVDRIAGYTGEVEKLGVKIVGSVDELLKNVDVVLLETNDGRLHLEQALAVIKAKKKLFIDKPIAASLKDAMAIFSAAKKNNVPVFSSSSLRYVKSTQDIAQGKVVGKILGADAYSPATLEKTHPDFFWYGIHGVETLYTLMGKGCKNVVRVNTPDTDVVVGTWNDNRLGTFRGTRTGPHTYGGMAYGEKSNIALGPYEGYDALLVEIIKFFQTGVAPVSAEETLEICAFMEAADESKAKGGAAVSIEEMFNRAGR